MPDGVDPSTELRVNDIVLVRHRITEAFADEIQILAEIPGMTQKLWVRRADIVARERAA